MPEHPVAQLPLDGTGDEDSSRAAPELRIVRARLGLRAELRRRVPGALLDRADQLTRARADEGGPSSGSASAR